jgi:hypothetical protein
VTQTTVGADLLEALEILTELGVETVGDNLGVLAIGDVALSVKEPGGDLVLGGGLEDGDDTLELFGGELTSTREIILSDLLFFVENCVRLLCDNPPLPRFCGCVEMQFQGPPSLLLSRFPPIIKE